MNKSFAKVVVGVAVWTVILIAFTNVVGFWQVTDAGDPGFTYLSELMLTALVWCAGALVTVGVLAIRR